MKKFLIFLSFPFILYDCSLQQKEMITPNNSASYMGNVSTKADIKDNYQVTEQDLDAFVHYLSVHDSYKDNPVRSIEPYSINGKNAFYIINLENGWKIISSDKRGPIVLAQCEEGQYNVELSNEDERAWFETIACQIQYREEYPEEYYQTITPEGVENENKSLDFWLAINATPSFIQKHASNKQLLSREITLTPSRVYTVEVLYDSVDHLIPVYWHQNDPFNLYCPLISETSTQRCPAGCGPIAVAQTAYYLHYNNVYHPNNSPSTGSCFGWVGNYTQSFSNFSNTTWGNMSYSNDPYG